MSACSRCGTVAKATDKFCNVCGTPLARTGASNAPPAPVRPSTHPRPHRAPRASATRRRRLLRRTRRGSASIARCQMGHEIAPGASYCVQGHPIALDQMQFSNEPSYGGGPPSGLRAAGRHPDTAPRRQAPGGLWSAAPQAGYGAAPPYATPGRPAGVRARRTARFGASPAQLRRHACAPGVRSPAAASPAGPQGGYGAPPAPAPQPNDTAREAAPPRILRGFLVAYEANPSGDFWPLTGGRLIVGRLGAVEGIDISMQAPTISSRHAAMVVDAASGSIIGRGHRIDQRNVRQRRAHRLQRTPRASRRRPPAVRRIHDNREGHRSFLSDDVPRSAFLMRSRGDGPTTFPCSLPRSPVPSLAGSRSRVTRAPRPKRTSFASIRARG